MTPRPTPNPRYDQAALAITHVGRSAATIAAAMRESGLTDDALAEAVALGIVRTWSLSDLESLAEDDASFDALLAAVVETGGITDVERIIGRGCMAARNLEHRRRHEAWAVEARAWAKAERKTYDSAAAEWERLSKANHHVVQARALSSTLPMPDLGDWQTRCSERVAWLNATIGRELPRAQEAVRVAHEAERVPQVGLDEETLAAVEAVLGRAAQKRGAA